MNDNYRRSFGGLAVLFVAFALFLLVALAGCGTTLEKAQRVETTGVVTAKYQAPSSDYFEVTAEGASYGVSVTAETYASYDVGDEIDVAVYRPVDGGQAWLLVLR